MPTYEYKCQECGHVFDAFQSMTDAPLTECVECGGSVKRLIGAGAGIIFKGSGFYCTDYKNSGSTSNGSETKPDANASDKKEAKTATPAAAADSAGSKGKSDD